MENPTEVSLQELPFWLKSLPRDVRSKILARLYLRYEIPYFLTSKEIHESTEKRNYNLKKPITVSEVENAILEGGYVVEFYPEKVDENTSKPVIQKISKDTSLWIREWYTDHYAMSESDPTNIVITEGELMVDPPECSGQEDYSFFAEDFFPSLSMAYNIFKKDIIMKSILIQELDNTSLKCVIFLEVDLSYPYG